MKKLFSTLSALLLIATLFAQKTEKDANFHFKQENFIIAGEIFEYLLSKDTSNYSYHYHLGVCYANSNVNPKKALYHLEKVKETHFREPYFDKDIGMAYFFNHKFDEAKKHIAKFKETTKIDEEKAECDILLSHIKNAKIRVASPVDISFYNLGKYINTKMDEYLPFSSSDGEFLIYTSNQKYDRTYFYYYNNVYYSIKKKDVHRKGRALTQVNSYEDEFSAGISLDGNRVYVQLQGYDGFEDLVYTELFGKAFKGKNGLSTTINSPQAEYGATETINGDTIFFSSFREGGMGGMDIYFSKKLPTGMWSEPTNVGPPINTEYNEDYPTLSHDGKTLYFCSDGPKSMGGFDIFSSKINETDRTFSQPKHLGYPINTVFDNKTIAFSPNKRYAYVSAIRDEGIGGYDLYRIVFNEEDVTEKVYVLKFKTGTKEAPVVYGNLDSTLNIEIYKNDDLFGTYSYNVQKSKSNIVLAPGKYLLKISGEFTEPYERKIAVPDIPSAKKVEVMNIFLTAKPKPAPPPVEVKRDTTNSEKQKVATPKQ